jgi:hypothetical protein
MARHWGPTLSTCWAPQTFAPATVQQIARAACADLALVADPHLVAEALNNAAHTFLLGMMTNAKPSDAEDWADRRSFDEDGY